MKVNPLTAIDFYKADHRRQYPEGTTLVYSNFTPRSVKYGPKAKGIDEKVIFFGLQYFVKWFLIDTFNAGFFAQPKELVVKQYKRRMDNALGSGAIPMDHIEALHDLGYLPISLRALPEGAAVNEKTPVLTIVNTKAEFFWLTNYLETILSTMLWGMSTSATTAYRYKQLLAKYSKETGVDLGFNMFQGHDFSFRGMFGYQAAVMSGAAHMTSFVGTDTVAAIDFLEDYYNANSDKELIGTSVPACFDKETEVLTNEGFKKFKFLNRNELIAQYHEDGTISFVKPTAYFSDKYSGKMVHFVKEGLKYVDMMVTPNHKMVREKDGKVELFEAGDFSYKNRSGYSNRNYLPIAGETLTSGPEFSDLDRLMIAFQADGSFASHAEDYTGERTGKTPIRFSLKKERKKRRLSKILTGCSLTYSESRTQNREEYIQYWIPSNELFQKDFDWVDISKISAKWAQDFLNELKYWDGSKIKDRNVFKYSSTNKSCIDKVQAIASVAGYKTHFYCNNDKRGNRIPCYDLIIDPLRNKISGNKITRTLVDYSDYVYCVSVPTKMIVVRRNNIVSISGNTEHSVMTMSGPDGELKTFERLITKLYPKGIVSIVSDSFDFWQVLTDFLPRLKPDILARSGGFPVDRVVIRPDSGDPVKIICGEDIIQLDNEDIKDLEEAKDWAQEAMVSYVRDQTPHGERGDSSVIDYFSFKGKTYKITVEIDWNRHDKQYYYIDGDKVIDCVECELTPEQKGAVQVLWETFGGTISEKGFKVLDSHIGIIYGDSITLARLEQIMLGLKRKGFAANNVVLGVGSFTYQYATRDTYGFAMKATAGVVNGETREIFKLPKTDGGGMKKSAKGFLVVHETAPGEYVMQDQVSEAISETGALKEVFCEGELLIETTLAEIRERVNANVAKAIV